VICDLFLLLLEIGWGEGGVYVFGGHNHSIEREGAGEGGGYTYTIDIYTGSSFVASEGVRCVNALVAGWRSSNAERSRDCIESESKSEP